MMAEETPAAKLVAIDGPEFERIVAKRLREQAETLKLIGIDKQVANFTRELRMVKQRINQIGNLKELMVTREEFHTWTIKQEVLLANVITVDRFEDGDLWVRAGVPHGMDTAEQAALKVLATATAAKNVLDEAGDRHAQRRSMKVGVVTGVIGALTGVIFALVTVLAFLAPHLPHN